MNWTGGGLSRHSRNANSALTQRQKKHFAKAHSNILKGPQKRSPIKWSPFDLLDTVGQVGSSKSSTTARHIRHDPTDFAPEVHNTSQKDQVLDTSFESIVPHEASQGQKNSSSKLELSNYSFFDQASTQGLRHGRQSPSHEGLGRDELHDAEARGSNDSKHRATSLEDRRRKVLSKIDWVCTNIQHPIKLKFTVTGNNELLGKRRRISGHRNNLVAIAQPMISSTLTKEAAKQHPEWSPHTQNMRRSRIEACPKNRVRISIGGRHVAAGAISSTKQSKIVGGHLASSQASISDEMLLDGNDMSRQNSLLLEEKQNCALNCDPPQLAPWTLVGNGSSSSPLLGGQQMYDPHEQQPPPFCNRPSRVVEESVIAEFAGLTERMPAVWTGPRRLNNSAVDVPLQLDDSCLNALSHQHHRIVENPDPSLMKLKGSDGRNIPDLTFLNHADVEPVQENRNFSEIPSPSATYITDIPRELPSGEKTLQSASQAKSQRNGHVDSQPELFHPAPLTSRTSRVLHCALSEPDSTVAQIGVDHILTRSELLDEEIWKTWILSSPEDFAHNPEKRGQDKVSISPGVSHFGAQNFTVGSKPMTKETSKCIKFCTELKDIHPFSRNDDLPNTEGPIDSEDNLNQIEPFLNTRESTHHEEIIQASKPVDYKVLFLPYKRQPALSPIRKPLRVENQDESWMKFILSDNDDDTEEECLKLKGSHGTHSLTETSVSAQSSVIVNPSSDNTSSSKRGITISSNVEAMNTSDNTERIRESFSTNTPQLSNLATHGSNETSTDESFSEAPSSIDLVIHREPVPTSISAIAPSSAARKSTFAKPPRFPSPYGSGNESPETTGATAGSSLVHISKSFSKKFDTLTQVKGYGDNRRRGGRDRHFDRDIYTLEDEYDIESIEDD